MVDTPPGASPDDDEIEILEIVGIDEDEPAEDEPSEEIEMVFEDEPADPAAPKAAADTASLERFQRLAADFVNLEKRLDREREDFSRNATRDLVSRLLVVLDNFDRALAARESAGDAGFRQGIALIHRQMYDELCREGLAPVDSVGEAFDPAIHEAVATDPASPFPANTVVEEMQRGYYFRGQLLRPALVRVSTAPSRENEPSGAGKGV